METATPSNEFDLRTEEQVEKLVGDIGRVIRNAEPARRAGLKDLAETLLHEEIVTIAEEAGAAEVTAPRTRSNPLAAGILLAALGLGRCSIRRLNVDGSRRDPGDLGSGDQLVA